MYNFLKVFLFFITKLVSPINLGNISSFSLSLFLKYCEGHNYEQYTKEIKRPLVDNLQMCIENDFDYEFISPLGLEEVVTLLSETSQFDNPALQDLCLTKLALIIRSILFILFS